MKYIKQYRIFESVPGFTPEQVEWLNKGSSYTHPSKWTVDSRGRVDVELDFYTMGLGRFDSHGKNLRDLKGVRFGKIGRNFYIGHNNITSLYGSPYEVGGVFDCELNNITSLRGAPKRVGGHFICKSNPLTSLEGAPQDFGYARQPNLQDHINYLPKFDCSLCDLTNLEGSPQYIPGHFECSGNPLKSLKGGPQEVGGNYICRSGKGELLSLEGAPKRVGHSFICSYFIVHNGEWGNMGTFLKLYTGHEDYQIDPEDLHKVKKLILPFMDESTIDKYFKENPLDMDLLDEFPDIKAGMLQRTGLKDISDLARALKSGVI